MPTLYTVRISATSLTAKPCNGTMPASALASAAPSLPSPNSAQVVQGLLLPNSALPLPPPTHSQAPESTSLLEASSVLEMHVDVVFLHPVPDDPHLAEQDHSPIKHLQKRYVLIYVDRND